jgi:hypothetical protein
MQFTISKKILLIFRLLQIYTPLKLTQKLLDIVQIDPENRT